MPQSLSKGEDVIQYLQVRDEHLGPTREEMIYEIWEKLSRSSPGKQ
jgi:prolyl-tRNA synthetase